MSKALPTKKKTVSRSSSDSSSGSSSDSSSSSSSSSGSDSSSSSDSESSSSQESSGKQSGNEANKKTVSIQKAIQRKSIDIKEKQVQGKVSNQKPPPKVLKQISKSSTEDEDAKAKANIKKKLPIKPKSVATVTPKTVLAKGSVTNKQIPINPGGGKVPPKSNPAAKSQHNKANKPKVQSKPSSKVDPNKKKSIFSPENSSDSDNNEKNKAIKNVAPKPRAKAIPKTLEKLKPKQKVESKPQSKEIISTSSGSCTSDSSSSSDSESSTESSTATKKATKKPESDSSKQITRKSTRTANTRKSKHVLGKSVYTDTDSDTESTKRSLSRSPVKRAPVTSSSKGKAKKKNDSKSRPNEIVPISEERKCPIEGCHSNGHLAGRQDKHFTIDACPVFHNSDANACRESLLDRKKREEIRKAKKTSGSMEQKAYLQKIKDNRLKYKNDLLMGNDQESSCNTKMAINKNREPNLENFVPEYDLKLFRDAQALASEKIEDDLKTQPNTKGTKYIEMGKFEMEVWYQSPYPEEYARLPKLYICEYCLRYMRGRTVLQRHAAKCVWRHPPGEEVYRKDKISVWEVDGKRYKQYCQNLCLLAKFFLDHKTLYYDVEPFLFYVMTMLDNEGCHTVGYFSKEKNSFLNYNVSCILTLPPYQRQGYGRLLIDFSYLLTRVEGKIGSPEKPLSDLGLISYRSYWKDVLLGYLCSRAGTELSVKDISQEMAIHSTDIVSTLQALGMMKYWKGKHIILKKQDVLDEYVDRVKKRGSLLKEVDPAFLRWTPFVPPQPNPS
ncbi:PREDICTED: histone acetyltransferase KAT7 [Nicrophorus vespilloides]|uniref:Histone acetyltransferase n=1 Tax=Nicrophorus vespilloides TaxID=110193 RepID=A0ABM1NCN9_NICVS|nr:PREDICTED: histone acetyltransferase KAT7 [Nicrophorus vespilloides]